MPLFCAVYVVVDRVLCSRWLGSTSRRCSEQAAGFSGAISSRIWCSDAGIHPRYKAEKRRLLITMSDERLSLTHDPTGTPSRFSGIYYLGSECTATIAVAEGLSLTRSKARPHSACTPQPRPFCVWCVGCFRTGHLLRLFAREVLVKNKRKKTERHLSCQIEDSTEAHILHAARDISIARASGFYDLVEGNRSGTPLGHSTRVTSTAAVSSTDLFVDDFC